MSIFSPTLPSSLLFAGRDARLRHQLPAVHGGRLLGQPELHRRGLHQADDELPGGGPEALLPRAAHGAAGEPAGDHPCGGAARRLQPALRTGPREEVLHPAERRLPARHRAAGGGAAIRGGRGQAGQAAARPEEEHEAGADQPRQHHILGLRAGTEET